MKILALGDFHGKFPEKIKKIVVNENPDLILSLGDYASIEEFRPYLRKMFKMNDKGKQVFLKDLMSLKKYNSLLKKDYSEGKRILKELNNFNIPVLSVFGNGDWYDWEYGDNKRNYSRYIKKLKNLKDINLSKTNFKKIKFVGFGGYIDNDVYFKKDFIETYRDDEERVKRRRKRYEKYKNKFLKLMEFNPDILVTHYDPYKCLDLMKEKGYFLTGRHMGISFFNEGIKKHQPKLVLCGHMHENQGKCRIGKTLVINPGAVCDGKLAIIDFDEEKKKVKSVVFIK